MNKADLSGIISSPRKPNIMQFLFTLTEEIDCGLMVDAIEEGLNERKLNKENNVEEPEDAAEDMAPVENEEEEKEERKPRNRRPRKPVSKN